MSLIHSVIRLAYDEPDMREHLLPIIKSHVDLPDKRWTTTGPRKLDDEQQDRLWEVYVETYRDIGMHINSVNALVGKYPGVWLQDRNSDDLPDAFILYKEKPAGKKIALIGSDPDIQGAKKALISKRVELAKKSGWFSESSGAVARLLESNGINPIDDEEVVRKVLKGKEIRWLGDGTYERQIGSLGWTEKSLYGKPNV